MSGAVTRSRSPRSTVRLINFQWGDSLLRESYVSHTRTPVRIVSIERGFIAVTRCQLNGDNVNRDREFVLRK